MSLAHYVKTLNNVGTLPAKKTPPITDIKRLRARDMRRNDLPCKDIAEVLNLTLTQVYKATSGIVPNGRVALIAAIHERTALGISRKQIAEDLGVSSSTVDKYAK